ncbi:hypothetical protein [Chitinophaga sp. YIM B06452]|uniref:hypothetical protein n=1 Tax=Chitinophaga sp. YIM B06452 TaxID=3082158 RepID=UPI0031FF16B4
MKILLNGCWRTEIQVKPQNWNTQKASVRKQWHIWYRFHDPAFSERFPKGKLVILKGMNHLQVLQLRQDLTRELITEELRRVDQNNYNPIAGTFMINPESQDLEISPYTGLVEAMEWGAANIDVSPSTKDDIKSVVKYCKAAAVSLKIDTLEISKVTRLQIRLILDRVAKIKAGTVIRFKNGTSKKGIWSNNNFNHYKKNLSILFAFLDEYRLFDSIPTEGIKKKKVARTPRKLISDDDYKRMMESLHGTHYNFWRYVSIFEKSGARLAELLSVCLHHVDIKKKIFKVLVNKRNAPTWVEKEIDREVLHLWRELVDYAVTLGEPFVGNEPVFIFGTGLSPQRQLKPIREEQVTRRWNTHVKKKLGITADIYSLKHRRTTKDVDKFIDQAISQAQQKAAQKNSHTSTAMVKSVYDVKSGRRRQEIKRKLEGKKLVFRFRKDETPTLSEDLLE